MRGLGVLLKTPFMLRLSVTKGVLNIPIPSLFQVWMQDLGTLLDVILPLSPDYECQLNLL